METVVFLSPRTVGYDKKTQTRTFAVAGFVFVSKDLERHCYSAGCANGFMKPLPTSTNPA
jgi:hypothetical protein